MMALWPLTSSNTCLWHGYVNVMHMLRSSAYGMLLFMVFMAGVKHSNHITQVKYKHMNKKGLAKLFTETS